MEENLQNTYEKIIVKTIFDVKDLLNSSKKL